MGFYLNSVLGVSSNDAHDYFIYFIPYAPFRELKFEWVNDWVKAKFTSIASMVGPKGVIVAAVPGHEEEFSRSFWEISEEFRKHTDYCMIFDGSIMFGPTLIFTQSPIGTKRDGAKSVLINLRNCRDAKSLEAIFDVFVEIIKTDDWQRISKLPDVSGDEDLKSLSCFDHRRQFEYVILKPNVFGFGLDLNSILTDIAKGIKKLVRTKRRKAP